MQLRIDLSREADGFVRCCILIPVYAAIAQRIRGFFKMICAI